MFQKSITESRTFNFLYQMNYCKLKLGTNTIEFPELKSTPRSCIYMFIRKADASLFVDLLPSFRLKQWAEQPETNTFESTPMHSRKHCDLIEFITVSWFSRIVSCFFSFLENHVKDYPVNVKIMRILFWENIWQLFFISIRYEHSVLSIRFEK